MKIRMKLSVQFILITMLINMTAYLTIYFLSTDYRKEEFYDRLYSKALNTAKLLVDVNEIDRDLLKIIDQNTTSLQDEKVVVYNYKDEEIYNNQDVAGKDYPQEILDKIRLKGEIRFQDGKRECFGLLYKGQYDRYVVIAEAYDLYGIRKINNLRLVLIIVFISSILVTLIGGWIFAGHALKPIKRVIDEVSKIDDSNLHARVNTGNGTDEIGQLASTFNKMLSKLEEAFYIQKSFVSNASHELRTPLTAMTGQIEVSLMNDRTNEEYQKILWSVLEDIKSLTQLSNGLLLLAQTNTVTLISNFKTIRIDETLLTAQEQVKKKSRLNEILVEFETEPEDTQDLQIKGDDQLLKSAFINLLDNACKFSDMKPIKAIIDFQKTHIIIRIIDKGIGIPENEMSHIFAPFYRATNAQSYRGNGLGLALVKKILDMHQATISVHSSSSGTEIQVKFPFSS